MHLDPIISRGKRLPNPFPTHSGTGHPDAVRAWMSGFGWNIQEKSLIFV